MTHMYPCLQVSHCSVLFWEVYSFASWLAGMQPIVRCVALRFCEIADFNTRSPMSYSKPVPPEWTDCTTLQGQSVIKTLHLNWASPWWTTCFPKMILFSHAASSVSLHHWQLPQRPLEASQMIQAPKPSSAGFQDVTMYDDWPLAWTVAPVVKKAQQPLPGWTSWLNIQSPPIFVDVAKHLHKVKH